MQTPVPRRLSMNGRGYFRITQGIFFLLLGVGFGYYAVSTALEGSRARDALRVSSREVEGQVVNVALGTRRSDTGTVDYIFEADGIDFSGSAKGPKSILRPLEISRRIPIRYCPSAPSINHPAGWEWSPKDDIGMSLVSVVFMVLGIIFLVSFVRSRCIVSQGVAALASVTSSYSKGRGGYRANYEFHLEDGRTFTGGYDPGEIIETGTLTWVLYLPENPRRNIAYANSSYRIVT